MNRALLVIGTVATVAAWPIGAATTMRPNYDHVDTSRWRCRLCPFDLASPQDARLTVGALRVADAQPRFGRDNGLDRAGPHAVLNARLARRDAGGRYAVLDGADLGVDARRARLSAGRHGHHEIALQWHEIPHNVATDARTPYRGHTLLALATADDRTVNFATRRRKHEVQARVEPTRRVRLQASYARETKTGSQESYADFFYQATGLPKPVDFTTDAFSGQAAFTSRRLLLAADLGRSRFRNALPALEWQGRSSSGRIPAGRLALAPSNTADSAALRARGTLGRTVFSTRLHWGEHRQGEALAPYTTNTGLELDPPARMRLDGRVRTFASSTRIVSRLADSWQLGLAHRSEERDNRTPPLLLTPVLGDAFATSMRPNRAYDLRRRQTEATVRFSPSRRLGVNLGARRHTRHRAPQEIDANTEHSYSMEATAEARNGLAVSLKVEESSRNATTFHATTRNNPLSRRFYQAAREQRTWRFGVDYDVASVDLALGAYLDVRSTAYPDTALGLLRERDRTWGVEFGYSPVEAVVLSGFFTSHALEATTAGSMAFAAADWWYDTDDLTGTTGLLAEARGLLHRDLDVRVTYHQSIGRGRYATVVSDDRRPFPKLVSDHRAFEIKATYRWGLRTSIIAHWYREDYASADWGLAGVTPSAIFNVLAFGRRPPVYTNDAIGIAFEHRR
ncbi:MAG: MtrB/PioB family decaheme-associated outer membrane protein [Gammaproteobacteria bacterium]|nr:MtrB/PioB family decaheme-associated outer membrane protein [Gammaproteobacteria bacterium]